MTIINAGLCSGKAEEKKSQKKGRKYVSSFFLESKCETNERRRRRVPGCGTVSLLTREDSVFMTSFHKSLSARVWRQAGGRDGECGDDDDCNPCLHAHQSVTQGVVREMHGM